MSRMIPEFIDASVKSGAERKVFTWLKESPKTEDWVVLYSERIADHVRLIQGEIDFLILAPNKGIFAIEVKGGQVKFSNGIWEFIDRYGNVNKKPRGPFEQASDGMFSIIKYLKEKIPNDGRLPKLLFGYGVMFPDIVFNVKSPEFSEDIVFDDRFQKDVVKFVNRLHHHFYEKHRDKSGVGFSISLPSKKDVEILADILRPNFESYLTLSKVINDSEESIVSLTNEQYNVLDQIGDNKRILVLGGAGTGKTILALNALKRFRSLNYDNMKKAALVCFNSNLGDWIAHSAETLCRDEITYVGSFHSLLLKIIKNAGMNIEPSLWSHQNFYDQELPCLAIEALKIRPVSFEEIFIDEAQDIFNLYYFSVIDLLLNGGIKRGRWIMFADFNNQNIFIDSYRGENKALEFLEEWGNFAVYRLNINCRNTEQICREVETVSQIKYKKVYNLISGTPVNYITYDNLTDEKEKFINLVQCLENEGINKNDIVILSPYVFENSIASKTDYKIEQYNPRVERKKNVFAYSTIQAFKGLESKVVIVTDIDQFVSENLLYVAYSRARSSLYVFETTDSHKQQIKRISERQ